MLDEGNLLHLLAGSPDLFGRVLDTLPDVMVYVKDQSGRYVWGNQVLLDRSGLAERAALVGKTADDLFPPVGTCTLAQDLQIIRSGRPVREALCCYHTRAGDRFWCVISKFPMFDAAQHVTGLVGLSRDLPRSNERHHSYHRLARFLDFIDCRLEENVLIADAARHASTSMDVLARLVFEVFNVTPKQLLMKKRLERARRMLEDGSQSITEVSGACGYADHSAFTRQFKASTHTTPAQYRATFKAAPSRV